MYPNADKNTGMAQIIFKVQMLTVSGYSMLNIR